MKKSRLDDSDISDIEGYQQEADDGDDGIDNEENLHAYVGPLSAKVKEADSSTSTSSGAPRRLRVKTHPSLAHVKYHKFEKRGKAPIDFKVIKNEAFKTKNELQKQFDMRSAILSSRHVDSSIKTALLPGNGALDRIHESHRRMMTNQFVFCRACGLYALKKSEGLSKQCKGIPINNFGKAQLKKLLEGRCPVRGAETWPDGSHVRIRYRPICLDII